jgi:GntR family transcriptional regulator
MPESLYRRIAGDLEEQIEAGLLAPGAKLPTEQQLQEQHDASRNTVRDAIRWLTNRGLVQTRHGQGTFVLARPEPFITTLSADAETGLGGGEGQAYQAEVRAQSRAPDASAPRVESLRASGAIAAELGIAEGDPLVARHQQRFIDGLPYSLQTSYYPMSLVAAGATRLLEAAAIEPGTGEYLKQSLGLTLARYRDTIMVRVPASYEISFFRLPDAGRVSVIETYRTAFQDHDRPYRLTVSVFAADRNRFAVFVGRVPPEARDLQTLRSADSRGPGDA